VGLAGRAAHRLVAAINIGWGLWALLGGVYILTHHEALGRETVLWVFGDFVHGYSLVGWTLVVCGVVSLLGACHRKLGQVAAFLLFVVLALVGVIIQVASTTAQADFDSWLLFVCAFTCIMRWGLYELEPEVVR